MEEIIRTVNLTKQYGNKVIVDRVSISVKKGEIYGFLGLNGAGKTTTIRALLGMSKPSSGEVYLFGQRWAIGNPELSRRVGYMVEVPYAYPSFTVRENLNLMARLRGLPVPRAVDEIMVQLNLTHYADSKARDLSLGNAQKLGLAKALIHKPDLLILDEPTNALDPAGIVEIREMLKALASQQGITVFISSHILEEMSKMASRIGIIHKGVLLEELTTKDFETIRRKQLMIGTKDARKAQAILSDSGYAVHPISNNRLALPDDHAVKHPEHIARLLAHHDVPLTMLNIEEENLEDYFLKVIGVEEGK
ncbi:ABC-2 type transport system ATP-binding protein [Paenibacillus sp. UNCCL117]|uniref:ABC transporter ATP-binding protein n=1 Tax=unclassified Paenibacillus TaxID=185978 RepID=UPI00088846F0|nr:MULTISPECIES: ABC transporter ATP-binding protein [unclassified Paenibacillus]SDE43548.1 ABC-2 type transport system ATP-binding protein [Paenibacillus sp. cl123]SFW46019.1 ABC-2 type transport system ATP-binding protein [Paenibacillus sp. UNCCL117]